MVLLVLFSILFSIDSVAHHVFVQALSNEALRSLVEQKGAFEIVMQPVRELIGSVDESVSTISTQASTLRIDGSEAGEALEQALNGLGKPRKRDSPDGDADTSTANKSTKKGRTPKPTNGQPTIATFCKKFCNRTFSG